MVKLTAIGHAFTPGVGVDDRLTVRRFPDILPHVVFAGLYRPTSLGVRSTMPMRDHYRLLVLFPVARTIQGIAVPISGC
jgi:hypothetical protein